MHTRSGRWRVAVWYQRWTLNGFIAEQVALATAGRYFYGITGFAYTGRSAA
jgi:hypothetical protein